MRDGLKARIVGSRLSPVSATRRGAMAGIGAVIASCAPSGQPKPVGEAQFVEIGGLAQWVTIRGRDDRQPVLLHVHGGPGFATSAFAEEFAAYEDAFTLVQWDQRGAGRTLGAAEGAIGGLTLDQIVSDGIELARWLRGRLPGRPVILFGHSLGTVVGLRMLNQAPDLFAGYVGVAQFSDFPAAVAAQVAHLEKIAAEGGDATLGEQLAGLDRSTPVTLEQFFAVNRLLSGHVPEDDQSFMAHIQERAPVVMSGAEMSAWGAGRQASADALMPGVVGLDLAADLAPIRVPVVLVHGDQDLYSPLSVARDFYAGLEADLKRMVVLEGAGHFPHVTRDAETVRAILEMVGG